MRDLSLNLSVSVLNWENNVFKFVNTLHTLFCVRIKTEFNRINFRFVTPLSHLAFD